MGVIKIAVHKFYQTSDGKYGILWLSSYHYFYTFLSFLSSIILAISPLHFINFFYFLLGEYVGTDTREVHIHCKYGHNVTENVEARNVIMPFVIIWCKKILTALTAASAICKFLEFKRFHSYYHYILYTFLWLSITEVATEN